MTPEQKSIARSHLVTLASIIANKRGVFDERRRDLVRQIAELDEQINDTAAELAAYRALIETLDADA